MQTFCEFSPDYPTLLRTLKDPLKLRASERVIQFPFVLPVVEEKTVEELARITEKRKEQGKKLQEMAAEKRREKVSYIHVVGLASAKVRSQLVQKENDLRNLLDLKEGKGQEAKKEWIVRLPPDSTLAPRS